MPNDRELLDDAMTKRDGAQETADRKLTSIEIIFAPVGR